MFLIILDSNVVLSGLHDFVNKSSSSLVCVSNRL